MTVANVSAAPLAAARTFSRVVALGDSVTCGQGVGVRVPPERSWAALLARDLGAVSFANLAVKGALIGDVRSEQLPLAIAQRPRLATLCVGLNDVIKTTCDPGGISADITAIVDALRSVDATVVVLKLHDPAAIFRMPRALASQLTRRVALVNEAIAHAAEGDPGVLVVDLGHLQVLPACWAVDRIHPSAYGQKLLSLLALSRLGFPGSVYHVEPPAPSTMAHARWLCRHGLPWLMRRWPAVGPAFAGMAVRAVNGRTPAIAMPGPARSGERAGG